MDVREKLVVLIGEIQTYGRDNSNISAVCKVSNETIADHLISKGVTIPVRCGECKNYVHIIGRGENEIGGCQFMGRDIEADDFCSYGERE